MKQWLIIAGLLLVVLVAGYIVLARLIVPQAVKTFVPVKWQALPLGEKKDLVYEYLGAPDTIISMKDHWEHPVNKAKKYTLDIGYNADTVAAFYKIGYEVRILGFIQKTMVTSDSLRHK